MQITHEILESGEMGRSAVISLEGEVDMHESPRLREALLNAIAARPQLVVLDLEDVTFIDSSGVATLVEAMKLAKAADLQLVLAGMNDKVRDVFALARLDKFFRLAASRREALGV